MEQDKFALVERILKDVDNVMCKNGELYAFDIVPMENNWQNKSPVLHLENCLALESWCVKHVYMYCYSELMDKYFTKSKRKPLKVSSVNAERLTKLLNVALLLNPELTLLWNKRRELLAKSLLKKRNELRFAKLVLSRKPKCNDAFSYRRWILDLLLKDELLQNDFVHELVNEELRVCELSSDKCPNNYHSWSHRMWLIERIKNHQNVSDLYSLYIREYNFSEHWTSKHVSDFSCFHYRQFSIKHIYLLDNIEQWKLFEKNININLRKGFVRTLSSNFPQELSIQASESDLCLYSEENLIEMLLSNSFKSCNCDNINNFVICRKLELLFHELILNNELLKFYKLHETLWYHRRFIVHEILSIMYDYYGLVRQNRVLIKTTCRKCHTDEKHEKKVKIVRYDSNKVYSSVLFRVLITHERRLCDERRIDGDNYSERHEKYLRFIEGVQF